MSRNQPPRVPWVKRDVFRKETHEMNDKRNAPTLVPPPREVRGTAEEMRARAMQLRLMAAVLQRTADAIEGTADRIERQVAA